MGNIVEFNHNYTKLHDQRSGFLCWVAPVFIGDNFPNEAIDYDTDGKYAFEQGNYLQLVFLGDKEIPFTTYRKDNKRNRDKYVGKIGQVFELSVNDKDDLKNTIDCAMCKAIERAAKRETKRR